VCHNSACSGYAKEESFYRGWENTVAPASQERADAGKDAARYRWILENADVLFKRAEFFNGIYSHYPATHEVSEAIDAAILAANKEPK
jgi:hypothetical protein